MRAYSQIFIALALGLSGLSIPKLAQGQIITQTPRPDIPATTPEPVETLKALERVGRSGTVIKIPRPGALLFASFDSNADYNIDMQEIKKGISRAFEHADRDNDGSLSLVELEGWRVAALGSEHASPTNFAFAPNFARSVSKLQFTAVLSSLASRLDKDDKGDVDGKIALADLLKDYRPPRSRNDNCVNEVRRAQQQCRTR